MVTLNKTRTDLMEKFKKLIEEYNKRLDVEGFFAKLTDSPGGFFGFSLQFHGRIKLCHNQAVPTAWLYGQGQTYGCTRWCKVGLPANIASTHSTTHSTHAAVVWPGAEFPKISPFLIGGIK